MWESGANKDRTLVISYKSSSRFESALDLAEFIQSRAAGTTVLIHRDADFMTPAEIDRTREKAASVGAELFTTRGSDIEAYFAAPEHCAELFGVEVERMRTWADSLATEHHNALLQDFIRKRDDLIPLLYRGRRDEAPSARDLAGLQIPLPAENRKGKAMFKLINGGMHAEFGRSETLAKPSRALKDETLTRLITGQRNV
jgi:hypothetical protein